MRTPILLLFLGAFTAAHAAIHRVNNTGIAADFTTLQAAHDAATAGDTLHLEPSGSSYGNCTFTKQLVVIGPGWFLSNNPGTQANLESAKTGALIFDPGSNGAVVSGLDVQGGSPSVVKASFVRIERCRFTSGSNSLHIVYTFAGLNITGVVVNGCYISNAIVAGQSGSVVNDLTISNTYSAQINLSGGPVNGELRNCVMTAGTAYYGSAGISAVNNIFNGAVVVGGSMFSNNLFSGAPVPATNGNQINVVMGTVFVGGTGDAQYQLAVGSPAIGAGAGGADCGLFGGLEPYRLSGIPPVPSIFVLSAATATDQGTPLQVTISARSND
ncbi:MAG: hypothetical protein JNM31_15980 [Flavobacteriales bacterium]|nr:hypothetical protein [Flavobacteriales bacterium]